MYWSLIEAQVIMALRCRERDRKVAEFGRLRQAETERRTPARHATHEAVTDLMAAIARRFTLGTPVRHDGHVRG